MTYTVGFIMDQIAGHVTNYRNLRRAAEDELDIAATWHEIHYFKPDGMIERLGARLVPFMPTYATGILRGTLEVHRAIHRGRYDALFTNASVGVFFSRSFVRTPTMIDFDSTPVQIDRMGTYAGPKDAKLIANVKWRLFRDKLRSAAVLQAWSRWAKQSAVNEYGIPEERIIVNPPGVDLQFWRPLARLRGETDDSPLRVLFVGADFDRKGGSLLLEWYRGQRPEQVELHIVTREPVEARPGVYLYHNLRPNTAELLDLYQRSDLFVLPSLGECFGIATVEAMAAGLPVIASDVGGTADIIEPGRNGFIVPSADLAQLSEAIGIILRNRQLRAEMSAQSRQLAEERFDLQTNAHRTFEHLRRIARTPQPQGLSLGELPGSR